MLKNLLRKATPFLALASVIGFILFFNNNREVIPVDRTPGIVEMSNLRAYTLGQAGVHFQVEDKNKRRMVNFYDKGFDGTLDEIYLIGAQEEHEITNPQEVEMWEKDYLEVRDRVSKSKSGE